MSSIKSASGLIRGIDVDADEACALSCKPLREFFQESGPDLLAAIRRTHGNPLQLAVATETAREVAGDQADDLFFVCTNKSRSRRPRTFGIKLPA